MKAPAIGPGDALHMIIPQKFRTGACNCAEYAKQMNAWGLEACEGERFDEIVEYLVARRPTLIAERLARWQAKRWLHKAFDMSRQTLY